MTTKTGLMFHPHKKEVHFGKMNAETGIRIGDPIDVTGDFLGILPEMFKINTISKVEERDGSTAYHVALFDDELATTVAAAPKMFKALKALEGLGNDNDAIPKDIWQLVQESIADVTTKEGEA